jgi:hypothetical protein
MQGHLKQHPMNQPYMWGNTHLVQGILVHGTQMKDPECMVTSFSNLDTKASLPVIPLHDCQQKNNYATKTVNFNTLHIVLLCSYFLVSLTCINLCVSTMVKLNLAMKYIHTDLYCSMQMPPSFHIIIWSERTCLLPSTWSQMNPHKCAASRKSWVLGQYHVK